MNPENPQFNQDPKTLWVENPSSQTQLIKSFDLIWSPEQTVDLYDFMMARFADADEDEKRNIIKACGALGGASVDIENESADFLNQLATKPGEFEGEVIEGLGKKVFHSSLKLAEPSHYDDVLTKEQLSQIVIKSTDTLLKTITENKSEAVKIQALSGIYRVAVIPELKEKTINTLLGAEKSDSPRLSTTAFYELAMLINGTDQFEQIIDRHIEGFSGWQDRNACSNLVIIIGHSKNPKYSQILEQFKNNENFANDNNYQKNIDWALNEISKNQDEK